MLNTISGASQPKMERKSVFSMNETLARLIWAYSSNQGIKIAQIGWSFFPVGHERGFTGTRDGRQSCVAFKPTNFALLLFSTGERCHLSPVRRAAVTGS